MENLTNQNLEITNEKGLVAEKEQTNFLDTMLGKTINTAIDIGIRALLPEFVEDQVINIKDNLLKYGLKDGIKETVNDAIELGKSAIGIVTGKFDNINQMQDAVKEGGIIDGVSTVLDFAVKQAKNAGVINSNVASVLKSGKNIILNNVESNIEKSFNDQIKSETKISKYINNWNEDYKNQDFEGMKKEFSKIEKELKDLVPMEKTIKEARQIENIQKLINNKGGNVILTEEELELARKI